VAECVLAIAAPTLWDAFPSWVGIIMHSGISAPGLVAVVLNLFFNELPVLRRDRPSVVAAVPERGVL
jgi:xanthine/uracil permease